MFFECCTNYTICSSIKTSSPWFESSIVLTNEEVVTQVAKTLLILRESLLKVLVSICSSLNHLNILPLKICSVAVV